MAHQPALIRPLRLGIENAAQALMSVSSGAEAFWVRAPTVLRKLSSDAMARDWSERRIRDRAQAAQSIPARSPCSQ